PVVARVAINMRPARSSWGGGSEFVRQLARFLRSRAYTVRFDLRGQPDCIVMADPRVGGLVTFGPDEIEAYKGTHSSAFCLHRVNENDRRKGTTHVDDLLARANRIADHTVFVSGWLRDYHAERWFGAVTSTSRRRSGSPVPCTSSRGCSAACRSSSTKTEAATSKSPTRSASRSATTCGGPSRRRAPGTPRCARRCWRARRPAMP